MSCFTRVRLFLLTFIFASSVYFGYGQDLTLIEGMVADSATFKSMPYVNIAVRNKLTGTQSDQQGNFKLFATHNDTLLFSFVGYKTKALAVHEWEPGVILLSENPVTLRSVTVEGVRVNDSYYEELFREQHALWEKQNRKLPFFYSKAKKETKKIARLENENARVQTYLEVVVYNSDLKEALLKKYNLDQKTYYDLLTKFNEQNHGIMYYLSASELLSLIYRFYETNAGR